MRTATKMADNKRGKDIEHWKTDRPDSRPGKLRIIGGIYRGRQLNYSGDPRTRPMKDNIREAVFNLVGGWMAGKHVFDLFSGTGAIGLEALSRGASHATLIERHFPTAKILRENASVLQAENETTIVTSDTFFWSRKFLADAGAFPAIPWAVFCSPPYDLFVEREPELTGMMEALIDAAPDESLFVVESDSRFRAELLPRQNEWKVRQYSPAQISVLRFSNRTE